ncbi:hypothetical protein B0A49_09354 [Cryomyces minteri]|uniref:HAT C-terminal dimerisation domain-containing protein n=1 Tax=Cryomyces minteri TaxID=331657 RepID=A0A4U0WUY7_9PEZI|nr:hypothetical protein B0A49_09354 [Cryomyces minteri]
MLAYDRPQLKAALPRSHTTLSVWIKQAYADRHIEVKEKLLLAKSKLHISCDIWSSSNGFSLLGVVAHFLDENHKQQTALLGLPRLRGSHSGVNIAETLATIIQKYDISFKLGYFQMDNASNNNTCIDHLATLLPLPMKAHLRCMGHIINLVVQAILFGKGINTSKRELLGCSDKDRFTLWKQLHAIGKIHNTVRDILRSEARRRDFAECQQEAAFEDELFDWVELMLVVDGGVRWNATYYMLRRARKLRRAIDIYQKRHIDAPLNAEEYDHTADVLTEEDWTEVDRFLKLLKPFEVITKDLEGNARQGSYGAVWEAFTSMNYLSDILIKEEATVKAELASGYKGGVIMGLQKINEYWAVMRENPVYASAVILNLMLKYEWFVDHWRKFPKWASAVKARMESLFKDYVVANEDEDEAMEEEEEDELDETRRRKRPCSHSDDSDNEDTNWRDLSLTVDTSYTASSRSRKKVKIQNELQRYYDDGLVSKKVINKDYSGDLILWWTKHEAIYPTLARMAFDLFSVPATSSECERVFSQTKKLVTDERNRLLADTIEADECQKNWLRNGIVRRRQ